MFKFVGYEEKKGNIVDEKTGEVKEYHNYDLHFVTDEKANVVGHATFTGKARAADLKLTGAKELKELIGHTKVEVAGGFVVGLLTALAFILL